MPLFRRASYGLLLVSFYQIAFANPIIHHDFEITLEPAKGRIQVQDTITLPNETSSIEFLLHQNLKLEPSPGTVLTPIGLIDHKTPVPVQRYRANLTKPGDKISLHYSGTIQHSLQQMSQDYAGDLSQTPGIISAEGVYLNSASYWFPIISGTHVTFSMKHKLPDGWKLISQGQKSDNGWEERSPQDNIYLIAAPYEVYTRPTATAEAMVYLRQPDAKTAERYLEATSHYLDLYTRLLGPYPYAKFALVENFWETGYGMPSFTLLGPTVIRLPFIIHTSYPHEILHNWWGNGVFPDYNSGNWSEGLTSYLADHLLREQRGLGADYRRTTLQRYADSVGTQNEFPLTAFQGRHSQASQAIGYGKSMMFFHMLRRQLGDDLFIKGLRNFYEKNLFQTAGFSEIQQAFEAVSNRKLDIEFNQWITRAGAPSLQLDKVQVQASTAQFHLIASLSQTQPGPAYKLQVPILVQLAGSDIPFRHTLTMDRKDAILNLKLNKRPLRIKIDPQFDLFRRLDASEIPSSIGQLFGAEQVLIVLPEDDTPKIKSAYQKLADSWAARNKSIAVAWDRELDVLPSDRTIWLFGLNNRLRENLTAVTSDKLIKVTTESIHIMDKMYTTGDHSYALTMENPNNPQFTVGWIGTSSAPAIPLLGRKLPHYNKYGYLIFHGNTVTNILKGKWPLNNSVLNFTFPTGATEQELELAPLPALFKVNAITSP
ncbi:PDZ domain [hydrothermal vent metagenome]|uniref:PDZ domain n=1 Tax=hydrothermal vent metagenome TaxID=652676 RepID=A0A3B1BPY9_9ZZZZ